MTPDRPWWAPDARGVMSIALFLLTVTVFLLIAFKPELANNEFFKVIASAVIITGLLNSAVAHYYTSAKTTVDARDQVTKLIDTVDKQNVAAAKAVDVAATLADVQRPGIGDAPTEVLVVNPPSDAVHVTEAKKPK